MRLAIDKLLRWAPVLALAGLFGCGDDSAGPDAGGPDAGGSRQDAGHVDAGGLDGGPVDAGRDGGRSDGDRPRRDGGAGPGDGGATDGGRGDGGSGLCSDRTGGALITFENCGERFRLWITDDAFIDEALAQLEGDPSRVAVFDEVRPGTDCDPRYSWHVAPGEVSWADLTTEVCDGCPGYIEENRDEWIEQVGNYCPWSVEVVAVDDRRSG